jgi:hypothetical protein
MKIWKEAYLQVNISALTWVEKKIMRKETWRKTYNPSAMRTGNSQHLQHTRQEVKWK